MNPTARNFLQVFWNTTFDSKAVKSERLPENLYVNSPVVLACSWLP